jgi:sterol desaturase/sphingolipid hydroxylase (fatty acid hydroxylase superfamily)
MLINFLKFFLFPSNKMQPNRYVAYLLIITLCHYSYLYLRNLTNLDDKTLICLLFPLYFEFIYFGFGFFFYWMDNGRFSSNFKKFKLPEFHKTEISTSKIVLTVVRNHVFLGLSVALFIPKMLQNNFQESFLATLMWDIAAYLLFDAIFYVGHVLMHRVSWLRFTHFEHHNSFATIGLTGKIKK